MSWDGLESRCHGTGYLRCRCAGDGCFCCRGGEVPCVGCIDCDGEPESYEDDPAPEAAP